MNYLLAYLPDAYLMRMAEHFASLNPPPLVQPKVNRPPELMRDGQRSVTQGMVGKKIPACVTCHGAELGGREPGIPGLLGLRADYVSAQLGAWRFCVRTAMTPDCMQFIASSLNEPEVAAVPVGLLAAAAWVPRRARSNAPKQGQPPSSTHNSCATSSQATARAS